MSLADARLTFARFDSNHDGRLDPGEMGAAKVDAEWLALGDSNHDGTLTADEFVASYPLLLARHGRVASTELEAESLRLRAGQVPRTNPASREPIGLSKLRSGDASKPADAEAKTDAAKSEQHPTAAPTAPAKAALGPAAARLRGTPAGAEVQARVQVAREVLDQRLRSARQDAPVPATPTRAPTEPAPQDPSKERRVAGDAETVGTGLTAERRRAAREALDARIRAAAQNRPESRTDSSSPANEASAKDAGSRPATQPTEPAVRSSQHARAGDAAPEQPRAGSAAPKRPPTVPNEVGARPRPTPAPAPPAERPHDDRAGGGATSKPKEAPAHPDSRGGKGGG